MGQRANQDGWRGVAASQGGESRNGGRGPVKHGWGRSALTGVRQSGSRLGGPRGQTRGGEGRPAGPSVAEGGCARPGEQQVPTGGPAGRCWAGPGRPSRAALGPAGVGASPVTGPQRRVSGLRGAKSCSPLASPERRSPGAPLWDWGAPSRGGFGSAPTGPSSATSLLCDLGRVPSLPEPPFPDVRSGDFAVSYVHELDPRCCLRSWASSYPGGASVSM